MKKCEVCGVFEATDMFAGMKCCSFCKTRTEIEKGIADLKASMCRHWFDGAEKIAQECDKIKERMGNIQLGR